MTTVILKEYRMVSMIMLIIILQMFSFALHAQGNISTLTDKNIESATALVSYSKDLHGFWIKKAPKEITDKLDLSSCYVIGKNNKNQSLFVVTDTSIIEITLNKDSYEDFKKDKRIGNLKEKGWKELYDIESDKLARKFQLSNQDRRKEIEDSIAEVKRIEEIKAREIARREAMRQDSIRAAEADREYRETHPIHRLDLSSLRKNLSLIEQGELLKCVIDGCDNRITESRIMPMGLKNDTLIYGGVTYPILDLGLAEFHALVMNEKIKQDPEIKMYLRAWKDTLTLDSVQAMEYIEYFNYKFRDEYIDKVKKKVPNGYVESWSWDNKYGPASLNISFCNTNKKTIKYIKFFFSIYNDVGDVRGSGSVQGTGPVEEFSTGSWDFNRTGCWPRGDATKMQITKILITYMNGSTTTLTGNKLIFE